MPLYVFGLSRAIGFSSLCNVVGIWPLDTWGSAPGNVSAKETPSEATKGMTGIGKADGEGGGIRLHFKNPVGGGGTPLPR